MSEEFWIFLTAIGVPAVVLLAMVALGLRASDQPTERERMLKASLDALLEAQRVEQASKEVAERAKKVAERAGV